MGRGAGKGGDAQQWLDKQQSRATTRVLDVKDVGAPVTFSMEVSNYVSVPSVSIVQKR